jgi:hypothetical protein
LSISNFQYLITDITQNPLGHIRIPRFPYWVRNFNCPLTLKEVYLSVATPDDGSVNVVGNSSESIRDLLRVISIYLLANVPPVLRALEEVGLTVPIRKCGVNVAGQALPALGDQPRVTASNTLVCQLPVVITCQQRKM